MKKTFLKAMLGLGATVLTQHAASSGPALLDSVTRNLDHANHCVTLGIFAEGRAYAEMSLLSKTVTYATVNDLFGVSQSAIEEWSRALDGQVTFVPAQWGQADLVFEFKPKVQFLTRDVFGSANVRRSVSSWRGGQYTYRVTGAIEVAVVDRDGTALSIEAMKNIALHEVGHFLGFEDSYERTGVMGPINLRSPLASPSSAEILCLANARQTATTIVAMAELAGTTVLSIGR